MYQYQKDGLELALEVLEKEYQEMSKIICSDLDGEKRVNAHCRAQKLINSINVIRELSNYTI